MTRKASRFLNVEIGDEFDRLTVTSLPFKCPRLGHWRVNVRCKCGTEKTAIVQRLFSGNVKSCGCKNRENHTRFLQLLKIDARGKR